MFILNTPAGQQATMANEERQLTGILQGSSVDSTADGRPLSHPHCSRIVQPDDEDKDVDVTEKGDSGADTGAARDDSCSSDDDSDVDNEGNAMQPSQTASVIQSVASTLKHDQTSLEDKLSCLQRLQKHVLQMKEGRRKKVAKHIAASGLVDIWTHVVRKATDPGVDTDQQTTVTSQEETSQWQMLQIIYNLLVKISDKSNSFCKRLVSADIIVCTIDVLKTSKHKEQCLKEVQYSIAVNPFHFAST